MLGPAEVFLTSLPGIGIERAHEGLEWADHNVAHALIGLTDMEIKSPVGLAMRRKLRDVIGLQDGENLELTYTPKENKSNGTKEIHTHRNYPRVTVRTIGNHSKSTP